MVSTRHHPREFPDPETAVAMAQDSSPRKRTTRTSTANNSTPTKSASPTTETSPPRTTSRVTRSSTSRSSQATGWSHTPSNLTLIWLLISVPLVVWDTGYVSLRPHSMPGGSLSWLWSGYGMYGEVDHVYGFKAWNENNGWTMTQTAVNIFETAAYIAYLYIVYTYGEPSEEQGTGAPDKDVMGRLQALSESRTVHGRWAAWATLLAYSSATVTFWKTVMYWLVEALSGFDNIGHNSWSTLLFFWGPMNGAWIVFPAYMIYVFGKEVLDGLEAASTSKRAS